MSGLLATMNADEVLESGICSLRFCACTHINSHKHVYLYVCADTQCTQMSIWNGLYTVIFLFLRSSSVPVVSSSFLKLVTECMSIFLHFDHCKYNLFAWSHIYHSISSEPQWKIMNYARRGHLKMPNFCHLSACGCVHAGMYTHTCLLLTQVHVS